MTPLPVKVCYLENYPKDSPMLKYSHEGDAGFDLRAAIPESLCISAHQGFVTVPTGIIIEIPFGFEMQIRPRSGLAVKMCVTVLNSPGTIDAGYRGEVKVILINHSNMMYCIQPGDRIAQGVIKQSVIAEFEPVTQEELSQTERNSGGLGHTGR